MKRSHLAYACLMLLPVVAGPRLLSAQPTPTPTPTPSASAGNANPEHEAAQRLSEAQVLALEGRWDEARLAFVQAYAVHPTSVVLWDLALAEIKSDHFLDAARHLHQYRKHPSAEAEKLARLASFLRRAYARIGRLRVEGPASAILYVDGAKVDWASEDPTVVATGEHEISLVHGDQKHDIRLQFDAGIERTIALPTVPLPRAPEPSKPAASGSASGAASLSSPEYPAPATREGSGAARTVVLVAGASLTVAAAVTGIVFAVNASRADHDADRLGAPLGQASCAVPSASTACADLAKANSDRNNWQTISSVAFVAASVLGVATAATFLLWRSPSHSSASVQIGPTSAWIAGSF